MLIRSTEIRQHKTKPLDNLMGFVEYLQLDPICIHQPLYDLVTFASCARRASRALDWLEHNAHTWDNVEFFTIADALLDVALDSHD